MKKTSKILSIILAILMVMSIIPITASAAEPTSGICGDNLTWEFDEYTSTLTISGTGDMYYYDVYFNASNDEADDRPWQAYTSKIKNIIINEGVTSISKKAFSGFKYLCFVTIPSSLICIKENAFSSHYGIKVVNYLGSEEEWNNIDTEYDNVDLYKSEKFYFKDDYVPVSGSGTCGDNLNWTFDANTFTLTFFGTGKMDGFLGDDGSLHYEPNRFDGWRPWENYEYEVKHIVVSEGITSIGSNAFAMFINLESVEVPHSITQIGSYSFGYCINLTDVYFSGTEAEWNNIIMGDTFNMGGSDIPLGNSYNKQLDNATIHYNSTGPHTHDYEDVVTPPTCKEQGYTTYTCGCGDSYVDDYANATGHKDDDYNGYCDSCGEDTPSGTCGDNLTWEFDTESGTLTLNGSGEIPDYYNDDEDYYIKQPWDEIKEDIKYLVINEGITVIGSHAFANCNSLESVAMSSVATIDNGAFAYAESLESITMSNSIQIIENSAFYECVKLIYIYYLGTQTEWNNVYIGDKLNDEFFSAKVYPSDYSVPTDSGTYSEPSFLGEQTVSWELDGNTCTLTIFGEGYIPDEVAPAIGSNMYKYAGYIRTWEPYKYDIKRIVITEGITRIGEKVFRFFPNLTEVMIPTSVTEISNSAFRTCDSITDVYYSGTEEQWKTIVVGSNNESIIGANIHYNSIGAHMHDYETVVTPPTCTEQGYTTYTCECGDSYVDDYVDATGHNHASEITTPATHTETGIMTYTCDCGDTYTEAIEKLEKHDYESVVTAPTCTEQGYTTYICECEDSYVTDYVDALGHTEETIPAVAPTCTETGLTEGAKCSICGETLTEQKELPANGHSPASAIEENYVAPTCTEQGSKDIVVYCSVCDEEISRETETLEATGHADNDDDGYCDACNEQLEDNNDSQISIISLIMRIINFLLELFGIN